MIIYYGQLDLASNIILTGDDHRHCSKVTRRSLGDTIYACNGTGDLYTCTITDTDRHHTTATIIKTESIAPLPYQLTIAIAPTKNVSRLEWMIEKSIEIGIHHIIPLHTDRGQRQQIKEERLQKIIISAMKQSKNLYLPRLHPMTTISDLVAASSHYTLRTVAHCGDLEHHLGKYVDNTISNAEILVMIGPEGDFTQTEVSTLTKAGFAEVNLGPSRLRTETAGVVAASIISTKYFG